MARKKSSVDLIFLGIVATIIVLGFVILFSVSAKISKEEFGNVFYYVKHQALAGLLPGLILAGVIFLFDLEKLKKLSLYLLLGNLFVVGLVFLPGIGLKIGGARRWINLGFASIQPSELLKLTLPLYLAVWLEKQKERSFLTLGVFIGVVILVCLLVILQPDMSTVMLVAFSCFFLYFMSEAPVAHIAVLVGLGVIAVLLLIQFAPYRMSRFLVFLDPTIDPLGMGYQIKQSLIAVGSGGIVGKGLGLSEQKFSFLPNVISDSIFPAWSEETGLVGGLLLLSIFIALMIRTVVASEQKKDKFVRNLAPVLVGAIVFQAFLNMGAMIGILPLTGVPLPFISYGGSHLLAELAILGLVLNLLRNG